MKMKLIMMLTALVLSTSTLMAQDLPRKVSNVEVQTLKREATMLPCFGEKNLLIFYIDPDKHKQNEDFTYELEENHRAQSPNIHAFGLLNLKDSWLPNGTVCKLANKRTEKNGATVLADTKRALRDAWNLGDCNGKFVLLFVSKEGELVFMRKGELTQEDKDAFYEMIENYK